MFIIHSLQTFGEYLLLMGRTFSRPERMRMFFKKYVKEMSALGVDSIGTIHVNWDNGSSLGGAYDGDYAVRIDNE